MRGVKAHGLNRARQGAVKTAMQVAPRIGSIRPEIQEILPLILSGGAFLCGQLLDLRRKL